MKQLVVVCALVAGGTAHADQCQVLGADVGEWAVKVMPKGASFVEQCEPCGDQGPSSVRPVATVRFDKKVGSIILNGKVADLAYVYVQTGKTTFTNVALMTGCPTQGVAPAVSLAPAGASTALPADLPRDCKRYADVMNRLARCDKMPQASRDAVKQGFDSMVLGWKSGGPMTPETRSAMADACKQGADALEQALKSICP